jgi:methylmalonyl-CoA/ethylmalonyl-CoA epimerase
VTNNPTAVEWFGAAATFDHVGVAVRSLAETGIANLVVTEDGRQKVSVAFVQTGGITLELIEPLGEASPVLQSLAKGQSLVHLCFRVDDLDAAMAAGKRSGFHRLAAPVPAPAFDGRRIAWVFHSTYGVVELLESAS